jgi:NADH-quinone oxidoreductase subunit N
MLPALTSDVALIALIFSILTVELIRFRKNFDGVTFHMAWLGLSVILLSTFFIETSNTHYFGTWAVTGIGLWWRRAFLLSSLLATLFSKSFFSRGGDQKETLKSAPEFFVSILFINFGMHTVISGNDLLTIFVGLELATIPLYYMSAWRKEDSAGMEAATKYILMGGAATAFMLFSFSYLYGFSGTVFLEPLTQSIAAQPQHPLVWLAFILLLVGIGFKLTLFPFHMWAPDVYQGAPTPTTAFLSVSSKSVAMAFLMLMIYGPFAACGDKIQLFLLILAGFTMTVGNLGALKQTHLRRFMAYSSIAQAGYILMALAGPSQSAWVAVIYYIFLYGITNYATFFIISIVGEKRGEKISSLRGLSISHPGLAGALALCMFSLAGIPPVAGFTGKMFLFASIAENGYYGFVVFAALNSTVSLYYYLTILKEAYITKPEEQDVINDDIHSDWTQRICLTVLVLGVLLLGLLPHLSTAIQRSVMN